MLLLPVAVLALGGCAKTITKWNHPSASEDQWTVDNAGCRSRARRQVDKEAGIQDYGGGIGDDEFTAGYNRNMRSLDSKRRRQEIHENCLRRLGYTPAKSD